MTIIPMYSFLIIYLFLATTQLARQRKRSAIALAVCFGASLFQAGIIEMVNFTIPITFYATMFLVSFGWFCIIDFFKFKCGALVTGFLVLFQMAMVFNSLTYDVSNTMLYSAYPYIIAAVNLLMVVSSFGERDDIGYNNHSTYSGIMASSQKNKEHH